MRCSLPFCLIVLWGCARADSQGPGFDLGQPPDDLANDLAIVQQPDLSAAQPDLSRGTVDLADSRDLLVADLLRPPDLSVPCTVVPQGGCAAGMKCTTHDGTTTTCDPMGKDLRGKTCTALGGGVESCVAGTLCIDESEMKGTGETQCRQFCNGDADCGMRGFCEHTLGSFKICTQPCNALYPGQGAGSGCNAGLACYVYGQEHTDCFKPGTVTDGFPCTGDLDCLAGRGCFGAAGAGVCHRICNDIAQCNAGDDCFQVPDGAGGVWADYGQCCDAMFGC